VTGSSLWIKQTLSLFVKDIRNEFRQKYVLSGILLFAFVVVMAASFALGGIDPGPRYGSVLFWIILLFADLAGFSHSFIQEEEAGTAFALKLSAKPSVIYWGKMFFNIFLATILLITIIPLSIVFLGLEIKNPVDFIFFTFFAVLAMAVGTTLIAALTAKASGKGTLFTILSFPVLLPVLMISIDTTYRLLRGILLIEQINGLYSIAAYIMLAAVAGHFLFEFIWQEES
jgi:heme exporter protein B